MIRLVTGTPGTGKTLELQRQLIDELLYTENCVVTNIPIVRDKLLEWLEKRLKERKEWQAKVIDLNERLVEISVEESFEFFRYRSRGLILPPPPDEDQQGKRLKKREFESEFNQYIQPIFSDEKDGYTPCTYFLSEAHRFFNTADWASVGRSATAYLTHHRHLHDEIVFDTQHFDQLAKQLRILIAEAWVMQNQYNERFGPFKKPPCIRKKGYYVAANGNYGGHPFANERITIDPAGVAGTYKTTGALGDVGNRGAEEHRKVKGLPFWSIYAFGAAAVVAAFFLVSFIPKLIGGAVGGLVSGVSGGMEEKLGVGPQPQPQTEDWAEISSELEAQQPPVRNPALLPPFVTYDSLQVVGPFKTVRLSDGRVLTEESPELEYAGANGVRVSGEWLRSTSDLKRAEIAVEN